MMRFRLLGPLEIRAGEDWRGIGAPKWRSVLAALLINAGQIVPADALISEVWGDAPPARAGNLISIYVLRLRRLLGRRRQHPAGHPRPGLPAAADPGGHRRASCSRPWCATAGGRYAAGDPRARPASSPRRWPCGTASPLADVPPTPLVEAEAERLAELRLDATELRITAELACGGHAQAVAELRRLLADHPLREGLWLLLMRALDGAGRHAEALEVYGQARNAISDAARRRSRRRAAPVPRRAAGQGQRAPGGHHLGGHGTGTPQDGRRHRPPAPSAAGPQRAAARRAAVPARRPVPAQLPADVADFTGRDDQVKHLCDLLSGAGADSTTPARSASRVVAGAGGLGKTSLAVHAAHRVRGSFPDGQLYVDLLGATPHPLPAGGRAGQVPA